MVLPFYRLYCAFIAVSLKFFVHHLLDFLPLDFYAKGRTRSGCGPSFLISRHASNCAGSPHTQGECRLPARSCRSSRGWSPWRHPQPAVDYWCRYPLKEPLSSAFERSVLVRMHTTGKGCPTLAKKLLSSGRVPESDTTQKAFICCRQLHSINFFTKVKAQFYSTYLSYRPNY